MASRYSRNGADGSPGTDAHRIAWFGADLAWEVQVLQVGGDPWLWAHSCQGGAVPDTDGGRRTCAQPRNMMMGVNGARPLFLVKERIAT